jgi:hypothetical protein
LQSKAIIVVQDKDKRYAEDKQIEARQLLVSRYVEGKEGIAVC